MSEPQQPPVPSHGQPAGAPRGEPYGAPSGPAPQNPPYGAPQNPPYGAPQNPPYGALQNHPPQSTPPYGYPGQAYPAAPPAASAGGLGRVAFILALVGLVISLLGTLPFPLLAGGYGLSSLGLIGVLSGAAGVITFLLSVVALILGIVAVRRPGPHVLAGIAIGIAASQAVGAFLTWISTLFHAFL